MVYKLNIEEMEAAFRRAAHRALYYGTREERSGRFLPREPVDTADDARKGTQPEPRQIGGAIEQAKKTTEASPARKRDL